MSIPERLRASLAVGLTLGMSELGVAAMIADPSGIRVRKVAARWGRAMVERLGIRLTVTGGEGVDWDRPVVVMSNHNSHLDIPVLYASLPKTFGMLAKRELFDFPVFGRAMAGVGCIPIDRADATNAQKAIRKAADRVRAGDGIVVFPEGTRGDGDGIRPFKPGAFYLAQAAGVPIVPIGIRGTAYVCPRDQFRVRPGPVTVAIGAPISTGDGSARGAGHRKRLAFQVRSAILELSALPSLASLASLDE